MDQINNHTANFGVEDYKSDSAFSRFSKYSYKTVILEGYLPRLGKIEAVVCLHLTVSILEGLILV